MTTLEYIRHFRFFDYAIFDLTISFIGMYLISGILSKFFSKINIYIPKINWVFLTLPIGIIAHLIFRIITPMTKYFFDMSGYYVLKIIILISLIFGLRGIRRIKK